MPSLSMKSFAIFSVQFREFNHMQLFLFLVKEISDSKKFNKTRRDKHFIELSLMQVGRMFG